MNVGNTKWCSSLPSCPNVASKRKKELYINATNRPQLPQNPTSIGEKRGSFWHLQTRRHPHPRQRERDRALPIRATSWGLNFEVREDREGCGFAYGVGVGVRTRRRRCRRRRAAEGEEEALGGVGRAGGPIHRGGPRRLHTLLPRRPRFPPRHWRRACERLDSTGWMDASRSTGRGGKAGQTASRGILGGGARNREARGQSHQKGSVRPDPSGLNSLFFIHVKPIRPYPEAPKWMMGHDNRRYLDFSFYILNTGAKAHLGQPRHLKILSR